MHRRLLDALHSGDRGEKLEHLGVLRSLKCPGVLVEPAFLSSDAEGARLATPEFRDKIASAILAGIEDYAALLRSLRPASVTPSSGAPGPAAGPRPVRSRRARPVTRIRTISRSEARRFLRRAHLIDRPAKMSATALAHHGYIQIDPINICGRMHDHILRNRVARLCGGRPYAAPPRRRTGPLAPEERTAFEHHLPSTTSLSAFPLEAWPHLQAAMRERTREPSAWSGRLTPREREFAGRMMERFAERGALGPEDFEDEEGPAGLGLGDARQVDPPEALLPRAAPDRWAP
jgi:hypothetical protein